MYLLRVFISKIWRVSHNQKMKGVKKMEIRVRKGYFYDVKERLFKCKVIAFLPMEDPENSHAVPEACVNGTVYFFGDPLSFYWGRSDVNQKKRYYDVTLEAKTIQELQNKVDLFIKEEINKLKAVIKGNQEAIEKIPEDEVLVFEI